MSSARPNKTDAAEESGRLIRESQRDRIASRVRLTRLERALDWATSRALAPLRVATSCCGMSLAQGGDVFEALGSGPPAVSPRSADLLIVAGSLTLKQVPLLQEIYERMVTPRWVVAWGVCAISGGPYDNYATISGLSKILPVDVYVAGCPPAPEDFRVALEQLRQSGRGGSSNSPGSSRDSGWMPIEETRALRRERGGGRAPSRILVGGAPEDRGTDVD